MLSGAERCATGFPPTDGWGIGRAIEVLGCRVPLAVQSVGGSA